MLDDNSVHCMDYRDMLAALDDASADMILIDPPYAVTSLEWDNAIDHALLLSECKRVLKPNAPLVMTTNLRLAARLLTLDEDFFSHELVYEKSMAANFLNAKRMPMACHEYVLVFCQRQAVYNPQMEVGEDYSKKQRANRAAFAGTHNRTYIQEKTDRRYPRSIVRFQNGSEAPDMGKHPTQKPLSLFEYLLLTYSNPNALVVDCFCGSGTTALAARNTNRRYIVGDSSPEYVEVTRKRLALPFTPPLFGE